MRAALACLLLLPAAHAGDWTVGELTDKMTGASTGKSAYVESIGTLNLQFPYAGEQRVVLYFRHQGGRINGASLVVRRGQFSCLSTQRCTFRVRFDDGPVEDWPMSFLPSASSSVGFQRVPQLAERVRAAKTLRVEARFFRDGSQVLDFDVSGFDQALPP